MQRVERHALCCLLMLAVPGMSWAGEEDPARHPDRSDSKSEPTSLAQLSDEEVEEILLEGEIKTVADMRRAGWGWTKLLWIECRGRTLGAVFNPIDAGLPSDPQRVSYRYERAAYLLDRLLESTWFL